MSNVKKRAPGKSGAKSKKLSLNKETVKDLTVGDKGNHVRGGAPEETRFITCSCGGGAC